MFIEIKVRKDGKCIERGNASEVFKNPKHEYTKYLIDTLLKLTDLRHSLDMTYLFIAHDLQVVDSLCDEVLFLYKGKIAENISSDNLANAKNEYAQKLLNSVISFSI